MLKSGDEGANGDEGDNEAAKGCPGPSLIVREKLPIRRTPMTIAKTMEIISKDEFLMNSELVVNSPGLEPENPCKTTYVFENPDPVSEHFIEEEPETSHRNSAIQSDNSNPFTSSKKIVQAKKMPKTSAKRKGILGDLQKDTSSTPSSSGMGSCIRVLASTSSVSLNAGSMDTDEVYQPSEDTHIRSSSDDYEDLEDEDLGDLEAYQVVDNYLPNASHKWSDNWHDTEDYFDYLFRNGEVYIDEDFGKIKLREWMMFIDKKHFKMVFTDYCIQNGFSVVVRKADKERYTVECGVEACPFRIHASRLLDGFTWAIKQMNSKHTCSRLMMWAISVIHIASF